MRVKLEETLPGTGGGKNQHDELVVKFLFLLPFCALLFCIYRSIQVKTSLVPSPLLHSSFLDSNLIFCSLIFSQGREGSLCWSSFCNQIRYLYYKIRSNGTVGYSGVSTMNPSYQVSFNIKSLWLTFKKISPNLNNVIIASVYSPIVAAHSPRFLNT